MGKLDSITNLVMVGAGVFIFIKAYPLIQGLVGGLGSLGAGLGGLGLPTLQPQPQGYDVSDLRDQFRDLIETRTTETRAAHQSIRDLLQQGLERQLFAPGLTEEIVYGGGTAPGTVPGTTPLGIGLVPPGTAEPPPTQDRFLGIGLLPPGQLEQPIAPAGQFWINPLTQARLGAYIPGETPESVLALREQDIFPAIRGF